MEKFGLTEASGFAIYQYYAKAELALFSEEKIADVVQRCERASINAQTSDKVHFIIKKRLFDEPSKKCKPCEEDFVRWQIVEDIKNDRYPLKPEDIVACAAYMAQIQYGDAAMEVLDDYMGFASKVVPKRLLSEEMEDKIRTRHLELAGFDIHSCHAEFMKTVMNQPLFGHTVFSVLHIQQAYTSKLPRECWLAVGFDGVKILARRSLEISAAHPFSDLVNYIPAKNNILLVIENRSTLKAAKYVFSTENSLAIASLIKDYIDFHLST
ncbi:cytochrome c oxidase subunit 1 [Entophlyctis luteolus]|nr:cytochrome c oxidase subunit 1 [Entophlyctis luteolus]